MWRKILAGFIVFLFVVLAVPFAIVASLVSNSVSTGFYRDQLVDYSYEVLVQEVPKNVKSEQLDNLTEDDVRSVIKKVFSPEDLRGVVDDFVDNLKSSEAVNGELKVKLNLKRFSDRADVTAGAFADLLYEKLPVCGNLKDAENYNCIPENLPKLDFKNKIGSELDRGFFAKIPAEYVFVLKLPEQFNGNLMDALERAFSIYLRVGFGLFLFLLAILALVIWKPWKKIVQWEAGAVFLFFVVYVVIVALFKALGGIAGILGERYVNIIALNFFDFVIDKGIFFNNWILISGFISLLLWITFGILSCSLSSLRSQLVKPDCSLAARSGCALAAEGKNHVKKHK